jgi:hypothetical protein
MARNDAQRTVEEIEQDDRMQKRLDVLREYFESKSTRKTGRN